MRHGTINDPAVEAAGSEPPTPEPAAKKSPE